ncbi:MAG: PfkB family carbohydrate kinase [Propionicimonas sp.]
MRVVAIGDNCLDWYLDRHTVHPGGNAINVAVYCHRLGAESAYIGQFGTDWAGEVMIRALEAEGVDLSRIRRRAGTSGYATIENVDGDRVFRGSSDGVVAFEPDAEDYAFMAGADLIHTGDSSFLERYVDRFAAIAPVSFDFSVQPPEYCEPLLPHVSYATFSRPDLGRDQVVELIGWAHRLGADEVHVTQGADGSYSSAAGELHFQPAVAGARIVDTLGAGDSFIAGMLMARLAGDSLAEAAARASRFAASSCQTVGAFGYGEPDAQMSLAPTHRYVN